MSRRSMPRVATSLATSAVAVAVVAGCTITGQASSPVQSDKRVEPSAPSVTAPPQETGGSGVVAGPASSAFPMEARDIRLVRLDDEKDLALQFELFNGTQQPVEPYDIGMGLIERNFKLVDLPRGTAYGVQGDALNGRVSDNQYEEVEPGSSTTVTAIFTAPPEETTSLWFMTNVLLPVEVPISPVGSPLLDDDPVLKTPRGAEPFVDTLLCTNYGAEGDGGETAVEIKLPSDVLFEFAKSDLTPAAASALDAAADQVSASSGAVTIEGHTDAIGDDASNQSLSEARAASVQAALQERLGTEFTFESVGFGESRPVAPNTKPDGSDDPDGRALNRRVEIRTGGGAAATPPDIQPRAMTNDIGALGAVATVESVERIDGHLLATVTVTNPTSQAIEVGPGSGLTDTNHRPVGITLADKSTQHRADMCRNSEGELLEGFAHLGGPPSNDYAPDSSNELPAGASVHLWGFYTAPPVDVTTVDVEIDGFAAVVPTPITN